MLHLPGSIFSFVVLVSAHCVTCIQIEGGYLMEGNMKLEVNLLVSPPALRPVSNLHS